MKKTGHSFIALLLTLILLLGIVPVGAAAADTSTNQMPEPILYFDMEDISDGKVTNQADGEKFDIQGSTKEQQEAPNETKALALDGTTTYLNVGRNYQVTDAFTAAAWIKIDGFSGDRAKLFGTGRSGNAEDVEFNVNIQQSGKNAWWSISGVDYGNAPANTIALGEWQHVTWAGDADGITIYVNGKLVHKQSWSNGGKLNLPDYTTDMFIGTGMDINGNPFRNHMFQGAVDEVRLYDVALTAQEVAKLASLEEEEIPDEKNPYLKQDGTPAYGILDAVKGKKNWLETTDKMPTVVTEDEINKTVTMDNGSIRRVFSVDPASFYTKSYENVYIGKDLMTGENLPEVYLGLYNKAYGEVYEGKTIKEAPGYYYVGGTDRNTFQLESYEIFDECEKPFDWKPRSKSYSDPAAGDWPPPGMRVEFTFGAPGDFPEAYKGVKIKLIFEMYDNCAAMKKRVEITNTADNMVMVGRLAPDVLPGNENMAELMYTETTYTSGWDCTTPMDESAQDEQFDALHCLCAEETADSPFKKLDGMKHTCYDLGPAYELSSDPDVAPHETFISYDTYEVVYSTYWFEQQSLERMGFYRKVFPWITDNPLTMHNTVRLSKDIIDHAAAAGFEMIIQSYGSPDISGQMLSRDPNIIAQYKELVDYARDKGIEVGTYQAQYQLGKYMQSTAYGVNTGKVGGGWTAWCMASAAFDDYWDNFKNFVEQTGMGCVEIDGCFAGNACIDGEAHINEDRETDPADPSSTTTGNPSKYAFHNGYFDSKAMQWENAVRMLCQEFRDMDVYIKVPAWYYAAGGNKCGIGYDEAHWSQPRQHQLIYGRKLMHNASYIRTMSMSWAHIPFSNYQGGGSAAAFRPFKDNVFDYNWVVAQYLGNGVAADFRGPEIYDDTVKPILDHWVNVYQRYRGIINSDFVHISQADGTLESGRTRNTKMDTLYHVNANNGGANGEKGLLWVYNQTDESRTEIITVPMFYTGLTDMDYPTYPIPDSMGKKVDHWYGNFTNYDWLPTNVMDQPIPESTGTTGGADFVQEGVTVQKCSIDSNGNVQLEVTLEPMSFTYFAIYAADKAPEVEVEVDAVTDVAIVGEPEAGGVRLTWDGDTPFTVKENGEIVTNPIQTITGYNIYRDGELIGTSLTNTFVDEDVVELAEYEYQITALVGSDEGIKSEKLTVTINADTAAPALVKVKATAATEITLDFSKPMDKTAAQTAANYTLTDGKKVSNAVLSADGKTVVLTVDALDMAREYTLTIQNLTDASNAKNPLGQQSHKVIYGYLAYYPLDDADGNVLQNVSDGTASRAVGVTYTSGTGKNGCVYFNAADKDYADLGTELFNGEESYTISAFIWPTDPNSDEVQAILSAGQPGEDKAFNDLGLYLQKGKITFRTSGPNGSDLEAVLSTEDALLSDTWNQIVVTRDGEKFSLYLNGELQAEQTKADMPAYDSLNTIYLGAQTNNAGGDRTSFFGGRMDELIIYRTAMTPAQIAAAYEDYQQYTEVLPIIHLDFEDVADGKATNLADGKQYAILGNSSVVDSGDGSQGLKFDGSTYINMGNEYQLGGEYTVSAWINVAGTGDNRNNKIFGRGWTGTAGGEFYACIRNGGYNIDSSNVNNNGKASLLDFGTPYFPIAEWAHFAVTTDGTTVKVYKNGELHKTQGTAENLNLSGNTRQLLVGGGWNSTGTAIFPAHMFVGGMDNVRLYDAALTDEQIAELANPTPVTNTFTVTFMDGNTEFDSVSVEENKTVAKPENDPAKIDYIFTGWYTDEENWTEETAYDFSAPVTDDITLYAGWKEEAEPEPTIESISIDTKPETSYEAGDKFNPAGLEIKLHYSNGDTDVIAYEDAKSDFSFSPDLDTPLKESDTVVEITYGGYTADLDIEVMETVEPELKSITIDTEPKTSYEAGDKFDPTGLEIKLHYSNGDTDVMAYEDAKDDFSFIPDLNTPLKESDTAVEITYGVCTASLKIDVKGEVDTVPVTGVKLDKTRVSLYSNRGSQTVQLIATIEPADADNPDVTWSSDDENVATVDQSGLVTVHRNGKAAITVTTDDGGYTAECIITVTTYTSSTGSPSDPGGVTTSRPENGTVSVSNTRPSSDEKVTITVTPDEDYELDSLTITDRNGNKLPYTENGDGTYTFTYGGSAVTIEVVFTLEIDDGETPLDPGPWDNPFVDVSEKNWFYNNVGYVYKNGLMQGTSDTTFGPNIELNRAMLVTILWRVEDEPKPAGENPFSDVKTGWYEDAVVWASENDIVEGYGNGLFGPNDSITREQMAAILYRYSEFKDYDVSARADLSAYEDADQISGWALDAMRWANAEELINGRSDTILAPKGTASRAEAAAILHRFLEKVNKQVTI